MYCEDCAKEFNGPGKYCSECDKERDTSKESILSYSDGSLNELSVSSSVADSKRITKASAYPERQSPVVAIQGSGEEAKLKRELEDARERYTKAEFAAQQQRELAEQTQQELDRVRVSLHDIQGKYAELEKEKIQVERYLNEGRGRESNIESDVRQQRDIAEQAKRELGVIQASLEEFQGKHANTEREREQVQKELEKVESTARQQTELAEKLKRELDKTNVLLQESREKRTSDGHDEPKVQDQSLEQSAKLEMVIYGAILGIVLASLVACLIYFRYK